METRAGNNMMANTRARSGAKTKPGGKDEKAKNAQK